MKDKFFEKLLRFLSFLAKSIAIVLPCLVLLVFSVFLLYKNDLPSRNDIKKISFKQTSIIYDRNEKNILYEVHGDENRTILKHDEIPNIMRKAIIASEDDEFYFHRGIDIPGIFRAARENFQGKKISQGASTITQQLAKNIFLTREKTYERKIREIILALRIETVLSKNEILDLYLNGVSFGSNTYGVESAAQRFFRKSTINLTPDEAALLAALPKATSYYSPYGNHKEELLERRDSILKKLKDKNELTENNFQKSLEADTFKKIKAPRDKIEAPHFVFYLLSELEKKYGQNEIEEGGLEIVSSIDFELQKKTEKIIEEYAKNELKKFNAENASAVILDNQTGEILAMLGSRDFFDDSIDGEVNVSTNIRQPGSSIKPIVYASAFEKGYQPETKIWDVRTNFGPDGSGRNYIPSNYNGKYLGLVSMREALGSSLNIPAVKTLYLSGINNFLETAEKLGIESLKKVKNPGLSLGLGAGDLTLLELSNAYGILADNGRFHNPKSILEVKGKFNYLTCDNSEKKEQSVKRETAWKINSILSDEKARFPIFGFSKSLSVPQMTTAVKTGTTQEYRDAWTIGYTPQITVGVWVGNNDYSPMKYGTAGVYAAAPLWNRLMNLAIEDRANESFPGYDKEDLDNFMITGKTENAVSYYNKKTGEKLKEKDLKKTKSSKVREQVTPAHHSILYYIDKEYPLNNDLKGSKNDPMLYLWEKAINEPILENNEK